MRAVLVLVVVAACGGGGKSHPADAPVDTPPDTISGFAACKELASAPAMPVPVHATGMLSGADLVAPSMCDAINAPYGMESAGPDSVVRVDGLVPGTAYDVRLTAAADLSFYVVTGCSTMTGPASSECKLFVDATATGEEVGRFVASGATAYVIVDYFQSHPPNDTSWAVDVYEEQCTASAQCSAATPVCHDGECVQCATSFDCKDASAPRCDTSTYTCGPGMDLCLTDDNGEPGNDGPAGAAVLASGASFDGLICAAPRGEADFIAFDVASIGDTWDITLAWSGTRDLDLELYDATGARLGMSFWEHPEHVRLTYLAPGRYYARVTEYSQTTDATGIPYTLTVQRMAGTGCTSAADCAVEYRNQIFRGECSAGACVSIQGNGSVPEGGACDSVSDCASRLSCSSFFFVANASTRDVCARDCATDTDCAPLGASYVCTTYLQANFCVQKCTSDAQCPTSLSSQPGAGQPWARLTCDVASGRCLP
ncbi:MAG: hypothetical protein JO257_33475 [Deltaproteobacteria bacterium]|nr:hypothetical protein [Deltaproteobacteria bacterium]